jgi:MFS family permease
MLAVLRQPGFALLWTAGFISQVGDWLLILSLPLYVYQQTGSSVATGATFAAGLLPRIVIGSLAGVLVDRWDRKRTMVVADVLRAGLLPLLLLVQSPDWLWLVYVVAFGESTLALFFKPANGAVCPQVIAADAAPEQVSERLVAGNALFAQRGAVVRLVGPLLGGALLGLLGLPALVLLDCASFILSGVLIMLVRVPPVAPDPARARRRAATPPASLWLQTWRDWLAGLGLVRQDPLLSGLFTVDAVRMLADGIVGASIVIFVTQVLGGDGRTLGWWITCNAIGGLVGGALIGRLGGRLRPSTFFRLGLLLSGALALVRTNAPVLALALVLNALIGACGTAMRVSQQILLQESVADRFRGRVFGALGAMQALMMLVGAGFASTLGDRWGVVAMFNVMSSLYMLAGGLALMLLSRADRAPPPTIQFRVQPAH